VLHGYFLPQGGKALQISWVLQQQLQLYHRRPPRLFALLKQSEGFELEARIMDPFLAGIFSGMWMGYVWIGSRGRVSNSLSSAVRVWCQVEW